MVSPCQCRYVLSTVGIDLARTSIVALMSRISIGRLRVLAPEDIYEFGPGGGLKAELKVVNDAFWVRLLLLGDLVYISKIS
jgi:cyclopropane-fatty-acyl-phospholipid synthase